MHFGQLLRQLSANRYGDEVYIHISNLLAIPSIKYLVILNATQTNLPLTHRYAHDHFSEQTNELLRLAITSNNRQVIHQMLAIPALWEAAQRHDFYFEAEGLNLAELVYDKESSLIGLTLAEQEQVKDLKRVYKEKIAAYPEGIDGVINELRVFLEQAFISEEHLALRQFTLKENTYTLPFHYETLLILLQSSPFTAAEVQQIEMVYYKNNYHTAWRYLSKPNFWIHPNASYVDSDERGSWSTFKEYQSFVAYLWLAASDNHYPPLEKNVTVNHRIDLFIRQLALINRAHNWDYSRVKLTIEGRPVFDAYHNLVTEEYDDLEGDRPSCFSGVKRRLFQALLNHPLYAPIDNTVIIQLIKQEVRVYYTSHLQGLISAEIVAIQQDIANYWCDFNETERLKGLNIQDDGFIRKALIEQFTQRVSTYFNLIPIVLHPAGLENTFLAHYQTLSLDALLNQLIRQAQDSVKLISYPERLQSSAALTGDEILLQEILAATQEALSHYKAYHRLHDVASKDCSGTMLGIFINETKNFSKAAAFCETLQAEIEKIGLLRNVLHTLKEFFEMSSQTFYSHSFTSYLAEALAKLQLITRRDKNHYTQLEVVTELETWIADYLGRQEVEKGNA